MTPEMWVLMKERKEKWLQRSRHVFGININKNLTFKCVQKSKTACMWNLSNIGHVHFFGTV